MAAKTVKIRGQECAMLLSVDQEHCPDCGGMLFLCGFVGRVGISFGLRFGCPGCGYVGKLKVPEHAGVVEEDVEGETREKLVAEFGSILQG